MNGFQRVLLLAVCGGLMALAALAGQIGYGDDYGRETFRHGNSDAPRFSQKQIHGMTIGHQTQTGME
jgi:hypothetical protein